MYFFNVLAALAALSVSVHAFDITLDTAGVIESIDHNGPLSNIADGTAGGLVKAIVNEGDIQKAGTNSTNCLVESVGKLNNDVTVTISAVNQMQTVGGVKIQCGTSSSEAGAPIGAFKRTAGDS